jgi:hydroxymethylglutaryl-CoA lyase
LKIIECPRDGWQAIDKFIDTQIKANYINTLLKVGFNIIDFGSFVSDAVIPQLKDSAELVKKIDLSSTNTKLMSLVGNMNGARIAAEFDEISYISYPFSISPTFLTKNLNISQSGAKKIIEDINNLCVKKNKQLVVYLAMGFGNPYGDEWNIDVLVKWIKEFENIGVKFISITDVVGLATKQTIKDVFSIIIPEFPEIEFGLHLHTTKNTWHEKIDAAYNYGCNTFDSVINGYGGCPMTGKELLGNLDTKNLIEYAGNNNIKTSINEDEFKKAVCESLNIFNS